LATAQYLSLLDLATKLEVSTTGSIELEPSTSLDAKAVLAKLIVVAYCSEFEASLSSVLKAQFFGSNKPHVGNFGALHAVDRKFFTWFDWKANNVNRFLNAFGPDFVEFSKPRLAQLQEEMSSFLQLVRDRSELVHGDLLYLDYSKTIPEVIAMGDKATVFVSALKSCIAEFTRRL
jgi:hypothetical protein